MRWYSDEDVLDWVKVGPGVGREQTHGWNSKLFTAKQTRRGFGSKPTPVDGTMPFVVVRMGSTERRDIGWKARQVHQSRLRSQSYYIDRDEARADGFDRDGDVGNTWERVRDWAEDRRYFRMVFSPLEGERVNDWQSLGREFMDAFNGRLFTADERAQGIGVDWTATLHTNTDHPHLHFLMRGKVDGKDLWLAPGFIADLSNLARSVASDERHLGRNAERESQSENAAEAIKNIYRDMTKEDRAMNRRSDRDSMELE